MKILVVEDEILIAMMIEDILDDAGHQVLGPVASVEPAVELAKRHSPDLAFLNIRLAGGGLGTEVARRLRDLNIPSIYLSSGRTEANNDEALAMGFITKPCTEATILKAVEIAERFISGQTIDPTSIPDGLELFDHATRRPNPAI
jgi:DNA-binding response OmpR family regulator